MKVKEFNKKKKKKSDPPPNKWLRFVQKSPGSLRMQVVLQLLRPLHQNHPTGTRTVAQVWLPPLVIALKEG